MQVGATLVSIIFVFASLQVAIASDTLLLAQSLVSFSHNHYKILKHIQSFMKKKCLDFHWILFFEENEK